MSFFTDFMHQKVPEPGKVMPGYYRRALYASGLFLVCYFCAYFALIPIVSGRWEWVPGVLGVLALLYLRRIPHMNIIWNFLAVCGMVILWCGWGIYTFGWNYGLQHFLIVLLLLLFFNICISPWIKILSCLLLLGYRIFLFSFAQSHAPIYSLDPTIGIIVQTCNTVSYFLLSAVICVLFSSSIQNTERQLRLDNENLNKEAGTDPLTGLPNRREMISILEDFLKTTPQEPFSVAIADIDHFKQINDTYGHACGDMALVALTDLFRAESRDQYTVCRWGGEEFCFFLPGKNLDEAGVLMNDLNFAVERMPLEYEGTKFNMTITIGVEETDFKSSLDELLKSADEKLYLGKNTGRNRVVV